MPRSPFLALLTVVVLVLGGPSAVARGDPTPEDQRALEQVLAALEGHPQETVAEYRVAFRELGLVGDAAVEHLRALVRRYVEGPGFDDLEAHAFLGDRRFHHPIPEDVTFRGHPFLQRVEAANAHEWFRPGEELDQVAAQAALGAMRLHHRRLLQDRRYRAGDQVFANVAMDPVYADEALGFTWADPYAVIEVGAPRAPEELQARIDTLRTIYRELLAQYGEALGLHDLMAPWGGGPDGPAHVRSFEDGAPLTVFLYAGPEQLRELALRSPAAELPRALLHAWLDASGALHVTGSDRLAEAATAQALRWFARQQRRWGSVEAGRDAISEGFAQWFAAHVAGPEADGERIEGMRRLARAFADRDRPYPVFRLAELLALTSDADVATLAGSRWGVPAQAAVELFRDQAWALVRMLQAEPYRAPFLAYLKAWLGRETQYGMAPQVFRRTFDLAGDEAWDALEARWERAVREGILDGTVPEEDAADGARPFVRLLVKVLGTDDGAAVAVWSPLLGREVVPRTLLPHGTDDDPHRRIRSVYLALDAVPRGPGGNRPPVRLETVGPAPREDVRLVLLALLVAGYEDIEVDDSIPPAVRALLEAWRASDATR